MLHCEGCSPNAACSSSIARWAREHGRGFWVGEANGLKRLTVQMPALLQCVAEKGQKPVLLDIGAGIHGTASAIDDALNASRLQRLASHVDDSDALLLLAAFKASAEIHAFEPTARHVTRLRQHAALRVSTRQYAPHLTVHQLGVGARVENGFLRTCGYSNTWSVLSQKAVRSDCTGRALTTPQALRASLIPINVTSVDAFIEARNISRVLYAKVDVEGGEWDVLEGMKRLLARQQVDLLSFEYAMGWEPLYSRPEPLTMAQRRSVKHTLRRFVAALSGSGYDTYLVHALGRSWRSAVRLIPAYFSNDETDDALEICFDRGAFYGPRGWRHACWNDLIAVGRCSKCIRDVLFNTILPRTAIGPAKSATKTTSVHGVRFPECSCI